MASDDFILTSRPNGAPRSAKRFWFRLLENFFRRWPFFVIPMILIVAVGVYQSTKVIQQYKSTGSLNVVNNPLLSDITAARGTDVAYYETPSAATTRNINELLKTDQFVSTVAKGAGVDISGPTGVETINKIRSNVFAATDGNHLLQVNATWNDPQTSFQLAKTAIASYQTYVLDSQLTNSNEAASFWSGLAATYQANVKAAEQVATDWVKAHPAPTVGTRPAEEQLQLQRYNDDITRIGGQLTNAQNKVEEANLLTQQSTSKVGQGLQVVDSPTLPTAPEPTKSKKILIVATYLALAIAVLGAFLVMGTVFDRTIRSADDVRTAAGLEVVATVPMVAALTKAGRSKGKRKRKRKQESSGQTLVTA